MKSTKLMSIKLIMPLLILILALAACDSPEPTPTPEPTRTAAEASGNDAEGFRTFVVVTEESQASYIVQEEFFEGALEKYNIPVGNADIVGTTDEVSGEISLDLNATDRLGPTTFEVDLSQLTTDQRQRDSWIRENALESEQYPMAIFEATEVRNAPESYNEGEEVTFQLGGTLTVRDVPVEKVFDVTATLEGNTITGLAETAAQMTEFGFEPPCFAGTLCVENDFRIRIQMTATD